MSALLRGDRRRRVLLTVSEYAQATGKSLWTVRWELRERRLKGRDLNAGTGKKPRWRVYASELRKRTGR